MIITLAIVSQACHVSVFSGPCKAIDSDPELGDNSHVIFNNVVNVSIIHFSQCLYNNKVL